MIVLGMIHSHLKEKHKIGRGFACMSYLVVCVSKSLSSFIKRIELRGVKGSKIETR